MDILGDVTGGANRPPPLYLKELVRYIHLNPIRAGLVNNLEELNKYPYCGHSVLMGRKKKRMAGSGLCAELFWETDL